MNILRILLIAVSACCLPSGLSAVEAKECYLFDTDFCFMQAPPGSLTSVNCQSSNQPLKQPQVVQAPDGQEKGELCGEWGADVFITVRLPSGLNVLRLYAKARSKCGQAKPGITCAGEK